MWWGEAGQAEGLDRYWTALTAGGSPPLPAGLDGGTAAVLRRLEALRPPAAAPAFREALWRRLQAQAVTLGPVRVDATAPRLGRARRAAAATAVGVVAAAALAGGYAGARAVADRLDLPVIRHFQPSGRTVESDATAEANGVVVRVTEVQASAFNTVVTLAITVPDPLPERVEIFPGGNGRLTMEPDLLGDGWGAQGGRRLDDQTVELRLNVQPLPPGTERLYIEIPLLDVTDPGQAQPFVYRYKGPWRLAVDTTVVARAAEGAEPVAGPLRVTDQGVTFEVLGIERDGTTMRVTYRLDPPVQGPGAAGPGAEVDLSDGSIAMPAGSWHSGDTSEPLTLLFTVPEGLEPVRLRFQPVLRPVREPVSFTLHRTAEGTFLGEAVLRGERQPATLMQQGAYAHLTVHVPPGGRYWLNTMTLGGRADVTLRDDRGNEATPYHGSGGFRKDEKGRMTPDQVSHDFPIVLSPEVQAVTITAPGYTEVVAGDWTVPLQ